MLPAPTQAQPHLFSTSAPECTFVTIDEPTLTRYYHPETIVYFRAHLFISLFPFSLATTGGFVFVFCLHGFAFFRMSYNWNHRVYSLFRLASFI